MQARNQLAELLRVRCRFANAPGGELHARIAPRIVANFAEAERSIQHCAIVGFDAGKFHAHEERFGILRIASQRACRQRAGALDV